MKLIRPLVSFAIMTTTLITLPADTPAGDLSHTHTVKFRTLEDVDALYLQMTNERLNQTVYHIKAYNLSLKPKPVSTTISYVLK